MYVPKKIQNRLNTIAMPTVYYVECAYHEEIPAFSLSISIAETLGTY